LPQIGHFPVDSLGWFWLAGVIAETLRVRPR
jgi:hypothetical protein